MPTSSHSTSIPVRGTRAISAIAPGDGLEDVLAELDAELKKANDPETKAALEAKRQQLTGGSGDAPAESEIDRLRREQQERIETDQAKAIAADIVKRVTDADAQRSERIASIAREETMKLLGENGTALLQHAGSRYVGSGADPAVAKHVAGGGAVVPGTDLSAPTWQGMSAAGGQGSRVLDPALQTRVGSANEVQAIKDSKSISLFLGAVYRFSKGIATDGEREFLMETKAMAEGTDTAGGFTIPPDWMPDVLNLLRGVAVVRRANPRIVPFTKQMNQVQLSSGATAYYTAENAAIPTSQEAFAQVTLLTPHNLTGLVPVSSYLLRDSIANTGPNPITQSAEDVIRTDLATVMGLREDLAFLQGAGTSGEPLGLKNIALGTSGANINPIKPPTNGFQPTLPELRQIRNFTRRLNVPNPRWCWFFHSSFISYVEQLTDSLGRFLADTSLLQINDVSDPSISYSAGVQGTLDGVPFFASNQIPINLAQGSATNGTYLLLVNMNELVVGLNQDMAIDVSNDASYTPDGGTTWVSAFQNNQTLFRSVLRHDIAHRYPTQVVIQQGVLV